MGYQCPVCGTPQADARHLANHLAFTAVLGREDHEAWLDEHASGWSEAGEAELAPRVAEHAPETEYDQLFEDTAGGLDASEDPEDPPGERSGALFGELPAAPDQAGHGHDHGHDPHEAHLAGAGVDAEAMDPETREVLAEARELTREMLAEGDADGEAAGDGAAGDGDTGDIAEDGTDGGDGGDDPDNKA